ncbi:MAG TPA: hypothetical protein VK118_05005 [Tetragenococcus sp.]|nr:hypothetical protein [Tetragenococcus sp.]
MATFGKFDSTVVPSEAGKLFKVHTRVVFKVHNRLETGTITKQLKNSAVIEIDETSDNEELLIQSNGVIIINYKKMKTIE